jgi:hypothetical protein
VSSRREAAQLLRTLEAAEPCRPVAAPEPPAAARVAVQPSPAALALLPPIASLGPLERCGIILGGAAALTIAFGVLVNGLQSLSEVVQGAQAHAALDAHSGPQP